VVAARVVSGSRQTQQRAARLLGVHRTVIERALHGCWAWDPRAWRRGGTREAGEPVRTRGADRTQSVHMEGKVMVAASVHIWFLIE
jgi:reverse gyrase